MGPETHAVRRLLALACLLAVLTGCMLPDNKPRVSIEFGAVPELAGAEVLVDGKPVGKLEVTGRITRTAFPVEKGRHEVRLRHPQFDCEPAIIRAELDAQKFRLLVDVSEAASINGRPTLVLR
jgi:hypothetical protein